MRQSDVDHIYRALSVLIRRRGELGAELHPGLSLVAYTMLDQIAADTDIRATDLASRFGLDKSTVSRQLATLEGTGLVRCREEEPGRRGHRLELTPKGRRTLDAAASKSRRRLSGYLAGWEDEDLHQLAILLDRVIDSLG